MGNSKLKEDIRFLAVGAAGANVAQMMEKKNYKTYYVNLAQQDLDLVNSPNKLHIKNGEGASKNRDKAKEVLSESIDEVLETLGNQITEKYIFTVFSLGGGTGSGCGPFLSSVGHKGMKHHKEPLDIIPFDGAGLVTPECALKWARELKCQSNKKKFYLPSCFQFRVIPGIKGEVMVFDIKRFAREKKVSKIVELGGKTWDIFKDKIDVILTESQFKFWKQYLDDSGNFDYWSWRNEFDKECHGYKRTFNIVLYGVHPDDLPDKTMLSYQPEQSLNFTDEEIPEISGTGIDIYRRVASNIDEF